MDPTHRAASAPAAPPSTTAPTPRRRRVSVHQSVLDWIRDPSSDRQLTQRARLVLWQMFAQGAPTQIKSVRGAGRGWLRSDLGGNHGHQFYLWWARGGALPLRGHAMARDEVLVRAVRHHDETERALDPGQPDDWFPLDASDLDGFDLSPTLLPSQAAVLAARGSARMIRGQPGTGKTTVLARAVLSGGGSNVLYLTYSERLASQARDYFREFAAAGVAVRVATFGELLRELAREWTPDAAGIDDGHLVGEADRLAGELALYPHRYTPWEGRVDALHAELHAHFAGAALPEAFRGAPACPTSGFPVEGYVALRTPTLGERAATVAAKVGRFLVERDALRAIAPGPWLARRLLDALRGGAALPASLDDVTSVFVDEVQDLTVLEAALLVDVVAAIGRPRHERAALVVAGDEGQTVRPTDFDWGVLADLVARRFESPETFELSGNLRSPRALVSVVSRTWDLYRHLSKDQRPRGRSAVEVEETVSGRVARCRVRDDAELARLAEAFGELPRAAFVHPGARPPAGYEVAAVETFGSATAKGLDFSVVAVIGAGLHVSDARCRATQGVIEPLHAALARTMTDQLRVAVSRASDTLVFVDREGEPGAADVDRLCRGDDGEHLDGFLGTMHVDELIALLDRSDATAEELVHEYLEDVRGAMHDRARWALERARRARGLLGRSDSRVGVTDLALRADVMRLQGVVALLVAAAPDTAEGDRRELYAESSKALHAAKLGDAGSAALWLRDLHARPAEAAAAARRLLAALPQLELGVPEWRRCVRDELARWCERCAGADLPEGAHAIADLVAVAEKAARLLRDEGESLDEAVERVRLRAATALLGARRPDDALRVLHRMTKAPLGLMAECHEALDQLTEAADLYERAGATLEALRCVRRLADPDRAHALAEQADAPDLSVLRRLRALLDALDQSADLGGDLTDEESALLRRRFDRVIPSRRAARGGR